MEIKTFSLCNTENHIKSNYKKYADCKLCNKKKGLKRYYDEKDKISNQRKIYFEKDKGKVLQQ